jgi:hypothetical protein
MGGALQTIVMDAMAGEGEPSAASNALGVIASFQKFMRSLSR